MSDTEAVLFVNEAFYVNFSGGDAEAIGTLWSSVAPVSCIHPGWELLSGREAVLESWRSILRGGAPSIRCRDPKVLFYGNAAIVLCYEEIDGTFLVATNIFVRESGTWKMAHHQAAPTRGKPADDLNGSEKPKVN
ncbi:MAG: nuclear transport factor 2 family protein [Pseudomonadota bacterium]|nr:nuclear transport factor 2 family protein [Pseudomonadota bacterium]